MGAKFASDPKDLITDDAKMAKFMKIVTYIIKGVVIDLNHETVEFGKISITSQCSRTVSKFLDWVMR
jgi:hypothetical protein